MTGGNFKQNSTLFVLSNIRKKSVQRQGVVLRIVKMLTVLSLARYTTKHSRQSRSAWICGFIASTTCAQRTRKRAGLNASGKRSNVPSLLAAWSSGIVQSLDQLIACLTVHICHSCMNHPNVNEFLSELFRDKSFRASWFKSSSDSYRTTYSFQAPLDEKPKL